MSSSFTFKECPRPQFVRDNWVILDGDWDFRFDDTDGNWPIRTGFEKGFEKQYTIKVPFAYQSAMSGIGIIDRHDSVWYQKIIKINKVVGYRNILHLEGADYTVRVYLNGQYIDCDSGPYHRMSFDLTDFAIDGENLLVINCLDDFSQEKPRGKQRWTYEPFECWYINTTGIYKSVWMENVPVTRIESYRVRTSYKNSEINLTIKFAGFLTNSTLSVIVSYKGRNVAEKEITNLTDVTDVTLKLKESAVLWDIGNGNLYDLTFKLVTESGTDEVRGYCAFRDITIEDGIIKLNGKDLYQKLVLDQGYWAKSHLTAPSAFDLYNDIVKMREFGFNGARKHQKIDDERFYYYADKLGYLVWCEMPSMYRQTPDSKLIFEKEWKHILEEHVNHPCVITWLIFNESWGCDHIENNKGEIDFSIKMYDITKEFDSSRIIIANDGWEHTVCDVLSIHYYEQDGNKLYESLKNKEKLFSRWDFHTKNPYAKGFFYNNEPILLTEFGGSALKSKTESGANWGYGESCEDVNKIIERINLLFESVQKIPFIQGYCYTQLSDVQTEVNGLLDENHYPKVDPSIIKKFQDRH